MLFVLGRNHFCLISILRRKKSSADVLRLCDMMRRSNRAKVSCHREAGLGLGLQAGLPSCRAGRPPLHSRPRAVRACLCSWLQNLLEAGSRGSGERRPRPRVLVSGCLPSPCPLQRPVHDPSTVFFTAEFFVSLHEFFARLWFSKQFYQK